MDKNILRHFLYFWKLLESISITSLWIKLIYFKKTQQTTYKISPFCKWGFFLWISFLKNDKAKKALSIETKSREVVYSVMHFHVLKFLPLYRYIIKQVNSRNLPFTNVTFLPGPLPSVNIFTAPQSKVLLRKSTLFAEEVHHFPSSFDLH